MMSIFDAPVRKKCACWDCRNIAKYCIGDKTKPYTVTNYYICEKHAEQLYNSLKEKYGSDNIVESNTVENKDSLDREFTKLYCKNIGKISRVDLLEFCKANGIEIEKPEEITVRDIIKLLFER